MNEPFDVMHPGELMMGRETRPHGLERLDPRIKLAAILCASALAVTFDQVASLAVLTGLCAVSVALARLPRERLRPLLILIALATWSTVFSQALFYESLPRTTLLTVLPQVTLGPVGLGPPGWGPFALGPVAVPGLASIGPFTFPGLHLYREGLVHGLVQSLRFDALILLGSSVCMTTSPERLFLGLTRLKVPFGLSFMAVTAVRFLPLVLDELRTVLAVRRLRGYRPFRRGLRATVKVEAGTLKPVVVKALRKATDLATSLSLRAFDPAGARTSYRSLKLSPGEWVGLGALLGVTVALISLKVLFLLYLHEVLYLPAFRELYGWVRETL